MDKEKLSKLYGAIAEQYKQKGFEIAEYDIFEKKFFEDNNFRKGIYEGLIGGVKNAGYEPIDFPSWEKQYLPSQNKSTTKIQNKPAHRGLAGEYLLSLFGSAAQQAITGITSVATDLYARMRQFENIPLTGSNINRTVINTNPIEVREHYKKGIELAIDIDEKIDDFFAPIINKEYKDDPMHKVVGQMGQIAGQLPFYLSPATVGIGAYSAIAMEGMELAKDIYLSTSEYDEKGKRIPGTGNLEKTMIAHNIGALLGTTDIVPFSVLAKPIKEAVGAKKLAKDYVKGEIKEEIKKESLKKALTPKWLLKTYATATGAEISQEVFQNAGEQWTKQYLDTQKNFDYDQLIETAWVTGFATLPFAAIGAHTTRGQYKKVMETLQKDMPAQLDEAVKDGKITEEKKTELLNKINEVADLPPEEIQKRVDEIESNLMDASIEHLTNINGGENVKQTDNFNFIKNDVEKKFPKMEAKQRELLSHILYRDHVVTQQKGKIDEAILKTLDKMAEFSDELSARDKYVILVGKKVVDTVIQDIESSAWFKETEKEYINGGLNSIEANEAAHIKYLDSLYLEILGRNKEAANLSIPQTAALLEAELNEEINNYSNAVRGVFDPDLSKTSTMTAKEIDAFNETNKASLFAPTRELTQEEIEQKRVIEEIDKKYKTKLSETLTKIESYREKEQRPEQESVKVRLPKEKKTEEKSEIHKAVIKEWIDPQNISTAKKAVAEQKTEEVNKIELPTEQTLNRQKTSEFVEKALVDNVLDKEEEAKPPKDEETTLFEDSVAPVIELESSHGVHLLEVKDITESELNKEIGLRKNIIYSDKQVKYLLFKLKRQNQLRGLRRRIFLKKVEGTGYFVSTQSFITPQPTAPAVYTTLTERQWYNSLSKDEKNSLRLLMEQESGTEDYYRYEDSKSSEYLFEDSHKEFIDILAQAVNTDKELTIDYESKTSGRKKRVIRNVIISKSGFTAEQKEDDGKWFPERKSFNFDRLHGIETPNAYQHTFNQPAQLIATDNKNVTPNKRQLFTVEKAAAQKTFRNKPLLFHKIESGIDKPIGANNNGKEITLDIPLLKQKFEDKVWTKPHVLKDGSKASPLEENEFKSFEEFFTFVLLHELKHDSIKKTTAETIGEYEDRINTAALKDLRDNYSTETNLTPQKAIKPLEGRTVAIIGTAGRSQVPTLQEWNNMLNDAESRVNPNDTLISGGAAWADHIAVKLFLEGKVKGLKLRLPAKIKDGRFVGGYGTAGGTANYYHDKMSKLVGVNTIAEIQQAIDKGAEVTYETETSNRAMFIRNEKVASESNAMIAYTYGEGNEPADGGTKDTWNKSVYPDKVHVSISKIKEKYVKEGVHFVFEKNPELADIGTKEQYSQYLNTIFPDSKVKDIVYHGTQWKFENFDPKRIGLTTQGFKKGFYFTDDKKVAQEYSYSDFFMDGSEEGHFVMPALVNIKNPVTHDSVYDITKSVEEGKIQNIIILFDEELRDVFPSIKSGKYQFLVNLNEKTLEPKYIFLDTTQKISREGKWGKIEEDKHISRKEYLDLVDKKEHDRFLLKEKELSDKFDKLKSKKEEFNSLKSSNLKTPVYNKDNDGVILKNDYNEESYKEIVPFEPEQIHILGSKQDIEGFRKFVKKEPSPPRASNEAREPIEVKKADNYIKVSDWSKSNRDAIDGTDADRIMRKKANGIIAEVTEPNSSSVTSIMDIVNNNLDFKTNRNSILETAKTNDNVFNLKILNEKADVIMLARNSELSDKPLSKKTINAIKKYADKGVKFVVGNSYIDKPFIDLLESIKADYTIYGHEGRKGGDVIPKGKTEELPILKEGVVSDKTQREYTPEDAQSLNSNSSVKDNLFDQLQSFPAFRGEAAFLSNFEPLSNPIREEREIDGEKTVIEYKTVENYYQAMKFDKTKAHIRLAISKMTPGKAKEATRKGGKYFNEIRENWNEIKFDVMAFGLKHKFNIPELKEKLLSTGDLELIERNNWGDTYWGVDQNLGGQNMLGKLLMERRAELRTEKVDKQITNDKLNNQEEIAQEEREKILHAQVPPSAVLSDIIKGLGDKNLIDTEAVDFGNWVLAQNPNIKIEYVNSDFMVKRAGKSVKLGSSRAAVDVKNKVIYINIDMVDTNVKAYYNTLMHEAFHPILHQFINPISPLYDADFRNQLEALYEEVKHQLLNGEHRSFYLDHQTDLDRIFNSPAALEEFVTHVMTNTSVLRQWMQETPAANTTNNLYLHKFIKLLKALFERLFNRRPSMYNVLENILEQNTSYTTPLNLKESLKRFDPENIQYDSEVGLDAFLDDANSSINPAAVRNLGKILMDENNIRDIDAIRYIKQLSYQKFKELAENSEEWNRLIKVQWEKRHKSSITLAAYKDSIIYRIYQQAISLTHTPTIQLNVNVLEENNIMSNVTELGEIWYDKDLIRKTNWYQRIRLEDYIPAFEQLLGVEIELVRITDVKFIQENAVWHEHINKGLRKDRNAFYSRQLSRNGYIFLGTWADKNTVLAIRPKNKENFKSLVKALGKLASQYNEIIKNAIADKVKKGEADSALLDNFAPIEDNKIALRLLIHDLDRGASIDEQGNITSMIYHPELPLPKPADILKRVPSVTPITELVHDPSINKEIFETVSEKTGLVLRDGKLFYRTIILNDKNSSKITAQYTFSILGKEFTINIKDLLVNALGTPTLDGSGVYLIDGFNEVFGKLHRTTATGTQKLSILNSVGEAPLMGKLAMHGIYKKGKVLAQWMKSNNIGIALSGTAVKISAYKPVETLGENVEVFEIPLEDFKRQNEKEGIDKSSKGMVQSFTANLTFEGNDSYKDAGMNEVAEEFVNNLVRIFNNKMTGFDAAGRVEYLKTAAVEGDSPYHRSMAKILLDILYNITDRKIGELKEKESLTDEEKETHAKLKLAQVFNNAKAGAELDKFFHEPYFRELLNSYVKKELSKVTNFQMESAWGTLRPDFGWLTPEIIEEVANNVNKAFTSKIARYESLFDRLAKKSKAIEKIDKEIENSADEEAIIRKDEERKSLDKQLDAISEEMDELEKIIDVEDGKATVSNDKIWKKVAEFIDLSSGRIKDGYAILSEDFKSEYGNNLGKSIITTLVPASSVVAQRAPKIIAYIPVKYASNTTIMLNSEYVQSKAGKDFDIDTVLIQHYSEKYLSNINWIKWTQTIEDTYHEFGKLYLKKIRDILGENITEREAYSYEKLLEALQILHSVKHSESLTLHNDMDMLLDMFMKEVGIPIKQRKLVTFAGQIGYNLEGMGHGDIVRLAIALARETDNRVDMPNNDSVLFYNYDNSIITKLYHRKFNDDKNSPELDDYSVIEQLFLKYLFDRGINVNKDDNYDNDNKRELGNIIEDIYAQQQINYLIDADKMADIQQGFLEYLFNNYPRIAAKYSSFLPKFLREVNFAETTANSIFLNMLNKLDLSKIPNIPFSTDINYISALYPSWQSNIAKKIVEENGFMPLYKNIKENFTPLFEELGYTQEDVRMAVLYLMTAQNPKLHILKTKIITALSPLIKYYIVPEKAKKDIFATYFVEANSKVLPRLMDLLLDKKSLDYKGSVVSEIELKKDKWKLKLKREGSDSVILTAYENNVEKDSWKSFVALKYDTKAAALKIKNLLQSEKGFFESASSYKGYIVNENLANFGKFLVIGRNTNISERVNIVKDILNDELKKFSETDKKLLWTSLLGHPDKTSNKIPYGLNLINPKEKNSSQSYLLELLSKAEDKSAKDFLRQYTFAAARQFPVELPPAQSVGNPYEMYDETFYFEDSKKEQKLIDDTISVNDSMKTIYDLHIEEKEKGVIFHKQKDEIAITSQINLFASHFVNPNAPITEEQILDSISGRYAVKGLKEYTLSAMQLTQAERLLEQINSIHHIDTVISSILQKTLTELIDPIFVSSELLFYFPETSDELSKKERRASIIEHITAYAERNPRKIRVELSSNKKFFYYAEGEPLKYETEEEFINSLNVPKEEQLLIQSAVELYKRHTIYDLYYAINVKNWIAGKIANLPKDFHNRSALMTLLTSWQKEIEKMEMAKFSLDLRVYTPEMYDKVIDNYINTLKDTDGKELDIDTKKRKADMIRSAVRIDNTSGLIYAHEMPISEQLPDPERLYIKDDFRPTEHHQKRFVQKIINTVSTVNYLIYEYTAINSYKGFDQKFAREMVNKTRQWYALWSNHYLLRSHAAKLEDVKEGNSITFYTVRGKYETLQRGIVDKVTKDYIYLRVNKDAMKLEYEREAKRILAGEQISKKLMWEFVQEGYISKDVYYGDEATQRFSILEGIDKHLLNQYKWGRYSKSNIYVKQYSGDKTSMLKGVMITPMPTLSDNILQGLQGASSIMYLGWITAGVRNRIDAEFALRRDLGLLLWFRTYRKAKKAIDTIKSKIEQSNLADYRKWLNEVEQGALLHGKSKITPAEKEHAIQAIMTKYFYEHDLVSEASLAAMQDELKEKNIVLKGIKRSMPIFMYFFKKAEILVRRRAAYMFAYKAIVIDGLTSYEDIKLVIEKGVSSTMSLYDMIYRKLGEVTAAGKFMHHFSQYTNFQKMQYKLSKIAVKELGQSVDLSTYFDPITKTLQSIFDRDARLYLDPSLNPNIRNRQIKELLVDLQAFGLMVLIPGLRLGNPINRNYALIVSLLLNGFLASDWDDWRELLFGVLALRVGFGALFIPQMLINVAAGRPTFTFPRMYSFTEGIIKYFLEDKDSEYVVNKEGKKVKRNPFIDTFRERNTITYLERGILGFNIIMPYENEYMTKNVKDFSKRNVLGKIEMLFGKEGVQRATPLINLARHPF